MLLFVNISGVWEYYMFDEYRVHSFQRESYDLFDLLKEFNSIFHLLSVEGYNFKPGMVPQVCNPSTEARGPQT